MGLLKLILTPSFRNLATAEKSFSSYIVNLPVKWARISLATPSQPMAHAVFSLPEIPPLDNPCQSGAVAQVTTAEIYPPSERRSQFK